MKLHSIDDLRTIYQDGEAADRELFSEQRSNILLTVGDHYTKRSRRFFNQIRDNRDVTDNQKLRLTKNHMHRLVRHYTTSIQSYAPGVQVVPQREKEMRDRKAAQLNQAVWDYAQNKHKLRRKFRNWCKDFVCIGETAVKIFWNPFKGELIGYEPKANGREEYDTDGNLIEFETDANGEYVPDKGKPVFSGDFEFETIFGYNLLRSAGAKEMDTAECWMNRKMVSTRELKNTYKNDPEKLKGIDRNESAEFIIFDANKSGYGKSVQQTLVIEYYFKPCDRYPEGYFFIATEDVILEQGPLPFGIFPIIYAGFDQYQSTPRSRSILKVARPYQAEVNRASSTQAQHQVTIGDDKILYQAGTKLEPGSILPGVRGISFQGPAPVILEGRNGAQYTDYIMGQIGEMEQATMMQAIHQGKDKQLDPYTMLYASAIDQQYFSEYSEKWEDFMRDVCELFLKLARLYMPDDELIPAVGMDEFINIDEFRSSDPLYTQVKLVERTENAHTMLGKQLTYNTILQYVGNQLPNEEIGKIIRNMPYSNWEESFSDLTIDYDNVQNDMLALERGVPRPPKSHDNHAYIIRRLSKRMKEPDFEFLPQQIQQLYYMKLQQHEQAEAEHEERVQAMKNEYIPVDGPMIACDMYVENPKDPMKAKRARVPQRALDWLIKQMDVQGASMEKLEQMSAGVSQDMAPMMLNAVEGGGQGQPPPMPQV